MQHIKTNIGKIDELQKKQAKGQKSINCMGRRLDIDEAIGILVDEDLDKQNMEQRHYEEENE
tara:strand:- start:149 stop:334 length:186 start_codon:yes stop_codon:yes gene_type:complete